MFLLLIFSNCQSDTSMIPFDNYPVYEGNDLGVMYTAEETVFKLWAPSADSVLLRIYDDGQGGVAKKVISIEKGHDGVWSYAY